jgi:hypothetical protein
MWCQKATFINFGTDADTSQVYSQCRQADSNHMHETPSRYVIESGDVECVLVVRSAAYMLLAARALKTLLGHAI